VLYVRINLFQKSPSKRKNQKFILTPLTKY